MLFNSLEFACFASFVFILYWFVFNTNINFRNTFLLLASYVFYGWWDWRFLSLIVFSSTVDYFVGRKMADNEDKVGRKKYLFISLFVNLGLLALFKYYNFFAEN